MKLKLLIELGGLLDSQEIFLELYLKECLLILAQQHHLLEERNLAEHTTRYDHIEQVTLALIVEDCLAFLNEEVLGDPTHLLDRLLVLRHLLCFLLLLFLRRRRIELVFVLLILLLCL